MQVRRWLSGLFIVAYLGCLVWGVTAHSLKYGLQGNTLSYFVVWDMFCGWQAFDNRTHLIAEGRSGQYYEVSCPWGEFTPFGNVPRVHYDVSNNLIPRHVDNVLAHTDHEPIARVYVVQEIWAKQYNVPPALWEKYFSEPREKVSYYNVRAVLSERGGVLNSYPDWFDQQTLIAVSDNPRLQMAAQRAVPFYNTFIKPSQGADASSRTLQSAQSFEPNTN